MWVTSASASMPSSLRIAPKASETPTSVPPSSCMIRAIHEPTLPKPWTTNFD